jgi:3-methylfumaryl-CoA hydratase
MNEEAPEHFREIERDWRPAEMSTTDVLDAPPSRTFAALLDQPSPVREAGDPLPPLWHWFHFAEVYPSSALGEDGHPADAAFTPPLARRRRMFGGGRLTVSEPLRCGEQVIRRSALSSVRTRRGGSGWLLLVTVRHEFTVDGRRRMVEEQDLVYQEPSPPAASGELDPFGVDEPLAAPDEPWRLDIQPDPVLLFRFSALTHNAHRIHYDRPYATEAEGHAGLVVHGPLLALLMLELPRRHAVGQRVVSFSWRARRPLFEHDKVWVSGVPTTDGTALRAGSARVAEAVSGTVALTRAPR